MTISTEVRKAGPFIGNDSASVFPFAFKVFKAADLIVVRRQDNIGEETTLILDSDYHVTLNSNQDTTPGGVVTLVAGALASGFTLVVSSELPYLQPTDLTNQGGFYPKVITNALDRLTIFCQQLAEITGRTLKLPITAPTNISAEIPLPNPSELIAWNETGTGLTTISPQSLVTSIAYGSATADLFAGDGVTTTFPLSNNPASVNNLDVSIGGFSQRPLQGAVGDYSWNGGASITFVSPPPAPSTPGDKNVLVRYMQAVPVADHDPSPDPDPDSEARTREALRRSYAEAGLIVKGYTKDGATLTSTSDIVIHSVSGEGYSWEGAYPEGGYVVTPETDPTLDVIFVDRSAELLRTQLSSVDSAKLIGKATYAEIRAYAGDATVIECLGRTSTYKPGFGRFYRDDLDTVTLDDGGCVLVDALDRRWKRDLTGKDEVLVEWYGECIQNLDISLFTSSAIDFALKNAIPYVTLPCTKMGETAFLWVNNITKDLGVAGTFDLTVRGHGVGHSVTRIRHTNTALGYGLTLRRTSTGPTNIFAVAALKNVWIIGNVSSKGFIRFADMFGARVEKVFGTGYGLNTSTDKGSLVTLANLTYWTEGAVLIDVHSRDNYALIKFERDYTTGGTSSFFGLVMKRCWHRFNSNEGGAIFVKGYSAENAVSVYGAMIEIGGWFEAGTGNALVRTGDYGFISESTVIAIPDGFGGNLNGEAVRICRQAGISSIDITLKNLGQQSVPVSLDGFATGTTVSSFASVGAQETTADIDRNGWPAPRLRMRGGSLVWNANPTTNKTLKIANLPLYSSLRVKLSVIGSNKTISDEYLVTTFGINEVADVKLLAGGTIDTHFFARTYNALAAKTASTNNGGLFELIMNATTAAGTGYKMKMEVTIL